jgi:hypothetical protein
MIEKIYMRIFHEIVPQSRDKGLLLPEQLQRNEIRNWAVIFKGNNWCMKSELDTDTNHMIRPKYEMMRFKEYNAREGLAFISKISWLKKTLILSSGITK